MSVKHKILFTVLFFSFLVVFNGSGLAQGQSIVKPDFGDGALEKTSAAMEELLQLKWNGQNLELKRDWDERLKKKKKKGTGEDDELEEAIAQLVERGLPEADAKRLAAQMADNGGLGAMQFGGGKNQPAVQKAFFVVQSKVGAGSSGVSGSGKNQRLSFFGRSLAGLALIQNDNVRFEFTESDNDERSFEIRDNGKGRFKFEFSFDKLFIRLLQSKTGETQLIWIADDKVKVYVGDSFSNLRKRNPQVVDKMLFPLFERLGIKTPVDAPDP